MILCRLLLIAALSLLVSCASSKKTTEDYYDGPGAIFANGQVIAPRRAPEAVHRAVAAANAIQSAPYQMGGGHGNRQSHGLDCSGSTSYVLRKAGLLESSMPSSAFRKYGKSGEGKWITVFARPGHVFMTICGLRLDTSSRGTGIGPRWTTKPRSTKGFTARHPAGL